MSLRQFLDHLCQSPEEMHSFFLHGRAFALRVLGRRFSNLPHQMLEDAVMHAFHQMWNEELGSFSSPHECRSEAFKTDLIRFLARTVAMRRLLDQLRLRKREVLLGDMADSTQAGESEHQLFDRLLPPEDDDPLTGALERQQLLHRLQRCVEHLTPKLHQVIHGMLEDLRQIDSAQRLGIPEGTVKSRMNEAVKKLKRCMGVGKEE